MQPRKRPERQRPELELGPLGGDDAYLRRRVDSLVRTFSALLDVPIKLEQSDEGGKTDCWTTIWLPFEDPEVYLVAEHELSHWLFESDTYLLHAFVKKMVSKLLNKAKITPGSDAALPFEKRVGELVKSLVNILEDHRCAGLWGELYAGGEDLLRQRWDGVVRYDIPDEAAEKSILVYFTKLAHGIDIPSAPQEFKDCAPAFKRAMNLVEGVDSAACLGITARLIDEIIDELIANQPQQPPQQGGGGGGSPQQGGKGQGSQRKKSSPAARRREKAGQKTQQNKQALRQLANLLPRNGKFSAGKEPNGREGMGSSDVQDPVNPKEAKRAERKNQGRMATVKRIMQADADESDSSGMTPLQQLMHSGANAMTDRIEAARKAMLRNQDDSEEAASQIMLGWAQAAGIPKKDVHPTENLPPPTAAAYEARRALEQFRMQKRRRKGYEGALNVGSLLDAIGTGELDRPFYDKMTKITRFELMLLFDYSGSMLIGQHLRLLERATADAVFAVEAINCKATLWGYSSGLYTFSRVGSFRNATGLVSGGTMMVQALDAARLWAKQAPTKRAVLHITDGWPTSCRAHDSTGDPIKDLHNVMDEIRAQGVPISTVVLRHSNHALAAATEMYDKAFGEGRYGLAATMDEIPGALVAAVTELAKGHITKRSRV